MTTRIEPGCPVVRHRVSLSNDNTDSQVMRLLVTWVMGRMSELDLTWEDVEIRFFNNPASTDVGLFARKELEVDFISKAEKKPDLFCQ